MQKIIFRAERRKSAQPACDCGNPVAQWRGSRTGMRMYSCEDCHAAYQRGDTTSMNPTPTPSGAPTPSKTPLERAPECAKECQYAKDTDTAPMHQCSGVCLYLNRCDGPPEAPITTALWLAQQKAYRDGDITAWMAAAAMRDHAAALESQIAELRAALAELANECQASRKYIVLDDDNGLLAYNATAEAIQKARELTNP